MATSPPLPPLRIGLLGFGKTGRLAATEILNDSACELVWVVRRSAENAGEFASRLLGFPDRIQGVIVPSGVAAEPAFWQSPSRKVDVLIDFSDASAVHLYQAASNARIGIVSAISHYTEAQLAKIREASLKVPMLHSANITIGINFLMVASQALRSMIPDADIEVIEEHFRAKKGVSGTAQKLAETLGLDPDRQINSIRVGGIVGKHEVIFGLPNQTIRMVHESISRAAFGRGALMAAKWLAGREPGMYSMDRIVREKLGDAIKAG